MSPDGSVVTFRNFPDYPSLSDALSAARHAMLALDPGDENARGAEFFCANPAQQLRAWFDKRGIQLASGLSSVTGEQAWNLKLEARSVRRGTQETPFEPAVSESSEFEYRSSDPKSGITQWFVNTPGGIEHGFTLREAPAGTGSRLALGLKAIGLAPQRSQGGDVVFRTPQGEPVLSYSGLVASDADGRLLEASMEARGQDLVITVDTAEARFPVTIDPIFAQISGRIRAEARQLNSFGWSVDIDGDTAVVGAPGYFGDVNGYADGYRRGEGYIFIRSGTTWRLQAQLFPTDGANNDNFGYAVSISGDDVLIGAPSQYQSLIPIGEDRPGRAYIYSRSGNVWRHEATLAPPDLQPDEDFGASVAIDGNHALVGDTVAEKVYAYLKSGGNWSEIQVIPSVESGVDGRSLSLKEDTVIIGGHGASVYAFEAGTWTLQTQLIGYGGYVAFDGVTALVADNSSIRVFNRDSGPWSLHDILNVDGGVPATSATPHPGYSVAVDGAHALIGNPETGVVHHFALAGGNWSDQGTIPDPPAPHWLLGRSLAIDGETALVGNPIDNLPGAVAAGSVTVLDLSANPVTAAQNLRVHFDADLQELYGAPMGMMGAMALIGAPDADTEANVDAGCCYAFKFVENTWSLLARLSSQEGGEGDHFGASLSLREEAVLVGVPRADVDGEVDAGCAYAFRRDKFSFSLDGTICSPVPGGGRNFAWALALSTEGAVILDTVSIRSFLSAGGNWIHEQDIAASEVPSPESFVHSPIDISGDRAIVGTNGTVLVFERSGAQWSQAATIALPDITNFGRSVALSGDTALVGHRGGAVVFTISGTDWVQQAAFVLPGGQELADDFVASIALDGDFALVGDSRAPTRGEAYAGKVFVYHRKLSTWTLVAELVAPFESATFGFFGDELAFDGETALISQPALLAGGEAAVFSFRFGEVPEILQQPSSQTVVPGQRVVFEILATGFSSATEPLAYQWRKGGVDLDGATGPIFTIDSAQVADAGTYDCVVSNVGGIVTSVVVVLTVNNLSQFEQRFPVEADTSGAVVVVMTPQGIGEGWRFMGEQQWRGPGVLTGIAPGERTIEFRPVPGYTTPAAVVVAVSGGLPSFESVNYATNAVAGSGGLQVVLTPVALAGASIEADRAQWRLLGPGQNAPWRDSANTVTGLTPGEYQVEFKALGDWVAPSVETITIPGGAPLSITRTYHPAAPGLSPVVLPFETVATSAGLPYGYVGQIRTSAGSGTGFVVKKRVVATAAHVVFDGVNLCSTTGAEWLFQRDRGSHEPVPKIPRGYCVLSGYAQQWVQEIDPGPQASPALQELDVAALWFFEDAGGGGFSGFLASDRVSGSQGAAGNEWLLSDADKLLVSYPVDGIDLAKVGRMHATQPANVPFAAGGSAHTYVTTGIRGVGGSSGGPLCVRYGDPDTQTTFYPAAVYLGGSGQAVVRAIDGDVVELFNRAELEGNGGDNSTSGGITQSNSSQVGGATDPGALQVLIEPSGAIAGGGGWRFSNETSFRPSGSFRGGLEAGEFTIQFAVIEGFVPPTPQQVTIEGGRLLSITFSYRTELETWRIAHFGSPGGVGDGADIADPDGDGRSNIEEFVAGTDPNSPRDFFEVTSIVRTGAGVIVEVPGKAGRSYELELHEPSPEGGPGSWVSRGNLGPFAADEPVRLMDPLNLERAGIYRVKVTRQ